MIHLQSVRSSESFVSDRRRGSGNVSVRLLQRYKVGPAGQAGAPGEVGAPGRPSEREDTPCASCHKVHAEDDQVRVKNEQPQVCYDRHKEQRTDFHKPSRHPVRYGQMAWSECHNTHGTTAQKALLDKPTLNQTCYGCHAEKRGPLLWEHAPVAEDCALCHTPHGSSNPALLTKPPPLLCQQSHSQAGHLSVAPTTSGLAPTFSTAPFLLGWSCLNCHTQVQGSNHPSGAKLMR